MKISEHIVVGIGASAGGLEALQQFFQHLPAQPEIAFVIVMHLHRDHPSKLHKLLAPHCSMPVIRIRNGMMVQPGNVYVLPENHYLEMRNRAFILKPRDASLINRAVDIFFTALSKDGGRNAVAIILSGTGTDGTAGIKAIEAKGGFVMVQHPDSTQFDGMPMSAIRFDSPDVVDTPEKLAQFISRYAFSFSHHLKAS